METALKLFLKQPAWFLILLLGVLLTAAPCVTVDKQYYFTTHAPQPVVLLVIGVALIAAALIGFVLTLRKNAADARGLDFSHVHEEGVEAWTTVNGCEIRVVEGRLEEYASSEEVAVVLPCNEYFDDRCATDPGSALGAFVKRAFQGQAAEFVRLMKEECRRTLGAGVVQQKTVDERAESFGAGRCLLLLQPLGHGTPLALVSTTTQRPGQGLSGRISYLFDGMRELVARLADQRISDVVMPVLGAGHGGIAPPLALVGLLLAVAEAARYGQGSQRLRSVKIVVYKRDKKSAADIDRVVIKRALALIATEG